MCNAWKDSTDTCVLINGHKTPKPMSSTWGAGPTYSAVLAVRDFVWNKGSFEWNSVIHCQNSIHLLKKYSRSCCAVVVLGYGQKASRVPWGHPNFTMIVMAFLPLVRSQVHAFLDSSTLCFTLVFSQFGQRFRGRFCRSTSGTFTSIWPFTDKTIVLNDCITLVWRPDMDFCTLSMVAALSSLAIP